MLLELVLVAAVLALAGLAVYQANHRQQAASNKTQTAETTENLATSAAAIVSDESADDANADILAEEVTASDADVTTLGGSSNAGF
jgi:Tfp pilus assembly protein PilV